MGLAAQVSRQASSDVMFKKCVCDVVLTLNEKKSRFRLKIVDDDVDWQHTVKVEEVVEEEEEDEAPVVGLFANHFQISPILSETEANMDIFVIC